MPDSKLSVFQRLFPQNRQVTVTCAKIVQLAASGTCHPNLLQLYGTGGGRDTPPWELNTSDQQDKVTSKEYNNLLLSPRFPEAAKQLLNKMFLNAMHQAFLD
jgi:hypothetical protein